MHRLSFLAIGFLAAVLLRCGGGGVEGLAQPSALADSAPVFVALEPASALSLAFEEAWVDLSVQGTVTPQTLKQTQDGADPQQPWAADAITGRWGTLAQLDGSVPGLPDVTGLGPNASWAIGGGRLAFHAAPATAPTGQSTGGFALLSRATFSRERAIAVEATVALTQGTESAFAGLALIAGEGDYRELAVQRGADGPDHVHLVAPLQGHPLLAVPRGVPVALRIEYDPAAGLLRYLVDGTQLATEALTHLGASFAADPGVGLYFVSYDTVPASFAEGWVGPVRVWSQ